MYIAESSSGITDEEVIKLANCESRILITNDKDFGELIFRQGRITQGILLIRAVNEESSNKLRLVKEVLEKAKKKLGGSGNLYFLSLQSDEAIPKTPKPLFVRLSSINTTETLLPLF
jgi:predicted nuclease of predicted toxin-antitoxin system